MIFLCNIRNTFYQSTVLHHHNTTNSINRCCVQVYDSNKAVGNVDDYNTSTRSLAAATLRNILGTRNLGEILSER